MGEKPYKCTDSHISASTFCASLKTLTLLLTFSESRLLVYKVSLNYQMSVKEGRRSIRGSNVFLIIRKSSVQALFFSVSGSKILLQLSRFMSGGGVYMVSALSKYLPATVYFKNTQHLQDFDFNPLLYV